MQRAFAGTIKAPCAPEPEAPFRAQAAAGAGHGQAGTAHRGARGPGPALRLRGPSEPAGSAGCTIREVRGRRPAPTASCLALLLSCFSVMYCLRSHIRS
ncbi:unnamed protein product [Rangifer tarandus platyrhynchus]|uniref:Uncharacterized protein n=2 Tax=Rangifer tarandus platyrhynchus TaxID=3082113 RepID=A0ACB0DY15_RANTA|nr:unnamed protein product [Rangifer tarandus platyrhynchus]CAI9693149.1 unnamed protein product [Rangifer tarandus platyrhynchus]